VGGAVADEDPDAAGTGWVGSGTVTVGGSGSGGGGPSGGVASAGIGAPTQPSPSQYRWVVGSAGSLYQPGAISVTG
jgi:hypothetical protein